MTMMADDGFSFEGALHDHRFHFTDENNTYACVYVALVNHRVDKLSSPLFNFPTFLEIVVVARVARVDFHSDELESLCHLCDLYNARLD